MVKEHHVRVYKSEENLPREDQLAFKIATVAADPVAVSDEVTDMVINRVIDNASVAIASLNRAPIVAARAQALTHGPTTGGKGSKVFGIEERVSPEWAAGREGPRRRPHTPIWQRAPPAARSRAAAPRRVVLDQAGPPRRLHCSTRMVQPPPLQARRLPRSRQP